MIKTVNLESTFSRIVAPLQCVCKFYWAWRGYPVNEALFYGAWALLFTHHRASMLELRVMGRLGSVCSSLALPLSCLYLILYPFRLTRR